MSTTVTYKDNTLTTVNNATRTLKTAGKYMEDDVILTDMDNTFVVTISYNRQTEMWEPDCTYAEVAAAYQAGKELVATGPTIDDMITADCIWNVDESVFYYMVYFLSSSTQWACRVYSLNSNGINLAWDDSISLPTGTITIANSGNTNVAGYATAYVPNADYDLGKYTEYYTENGQRKWRVRAVYNGFGAGWKAAGLEYSPYSNYNAITANTTVTPSTSVQTVGGANYMMEDAVTVAAVPTGQYDIDIVNPQFYDDSGTRKWRARADMDVWDGWLPEGSYYGPYLTRNAVPANTTVTPTTSAQTIGGTNYVMEGAVTVAAMPSGTAGTPTATKGTVSNHAVSVTPSVTNSMGYIEGGTKTGTAVSVSASELVSGTLSITSSGTKDVTNYASASVAAGGATASATKGAVSNHSVTVTPSVTRTAGYITAGSSNGTAVTVSASELVSGIYTVDSSGTKDVTNYASASIAAGSATASATKGTVSNHSVAVTPSVTRTAGWVSAGSTNGTAVTVSASELVSGTKSITANGTSIDVTNYANVDVAVDNNFAIELTYNSQTGIWEPDCTFNEAKNAFINNKNIVSSINYPGTNSSFDSYNELDDQIYYSTEEYDYQHYAYIGRSYIWRSTGEINEDIVGTRYDTTTATAIASDVANGKIFFNANGRQVGTASGSDSSSPYYVRAVVVPEQTLTLDSQKKAVLNDVTIGLSINGFYIITFNGVEYYATGHALFNWYLCLGDVNVQLAPSDANSMTPFHIVSTQDMTQLSLTLWCKSDSASTVSIKVEQLFFTDEITVAENIVPQQTVTLNSDRMASLTAAGTITQGYHYAITFDGVEYVCTAALLWNDSEHALGDRYVPFGGRNDYQYPFYISRGTDETAVMGITADTTHTVKVDRIELPEGGITIDSLTVISNGTYTAQANHAYTPVTVNVPSTGGTYQAKTNISPTTSSQTITPDSGYDALSSVQINAMPTGTAGTPTATKGTVSNHSISVTPSVTNTTGYITGSTKTGTAVTVSASELVSGSETKTVNGTYDVTNLASLVVNIPIITYYTSSSAPTSSQGSNGDLWLVTS